MPQWGWHNTKAGLVFYLTVMGWAFSPASKSTTKGSEEAAWVANHSDDGQHLIIHLVESMNLLICCIVFFFFFFSSLTVDSLKLRIQ